MKNSKIAIYLFALITLVIGVTIGLNVNQRSERNVAEAHDQADSNETEADVTGTTEASATSSGETVTATATTGKKQKVLLLETVPAEVADELVEQFFAQEEGAFYVTTTVTSSTTSKSTDKTESDETSTKTTATSSETEANDEILEPGSGMMVSEYKDLIVRKVLIKPEEEDENIILRDQTPKWQLIIQCRMEKDGEYWPITVAAQEAFYDPMSPYSSDRLYFDKKNYVQFKKDYYKAEAFIEAILAKYQIDPNNLQPYETVILETRVSETGDETDGSEKSTEENGDDDDEYILVDENGDPI